MRTPTTIITTMTMTMGDTHTLLRLMAWLSPVFPTGSFAYSAGLEQAVASGIISDAPTLTAWVDAQVQHGAAWNDAVIFVQAHRLCTSGESTDALGAYGLALTPSAERRAETIAQGTSFLEGARHWLADDQLPPRGTPLPVCVGSAAARANLGADMAVGAYLQAFVTNQLQAAIRLSITGQNGAAKALATLEPIIEKTAAHAAQSSLDDLGSATVMADIAAMNHETLQPRLFLS